MTETLAPFILQEVLTTMQPTTLKQRVLEAVEEQRRLKLHKDSVALEQALLRAGVIAAKLPAVAIRVNKQGQVRYDQDGVLFYIRTWNETVYDDRGEYDGEKEVSHLNAQLICRYEGCHRGARRPEVSNVRRLVDLEPLFNEQDQRTLEPYCDLYGRNGQPDRHNGKNDDGTDIYGFDPDELSDLPF